MSRLTEAQAGAAYHPQTNPRRGRRSAWFSFVDKDVKIGLAPAVKPEAVTVTGKTACAGCTYGVTPTTDPESLGIAVVVGDKVYIVEGGEKGYPALFKDRFDGIPVELKGTVRKVKGKFVWVDPTSLTRSR